MSHVKTAEQFDAEMNEAVDQLIGVLDPAWTAFITRVGAIAAELATSDIPKHLQMSILEAALKRTNTAIEKLGEVECL